MLSVSPDRPNLLLILTDQQAVHSLSCYGAPVARSPRLDQLAAEGIRFDRAYTPTALCTPARASLLTGRFPHGHGILFNHGCYGCPGEGVPRSDLHLFPEKLRAAGYRLGHQGKWHAGVTANAADVGFEGFSPPGYGGIRRAPEFLDYLRAAGLPEPRPHFEFTAEGGPPEESGGNTSGWTEGDIRSAPCHFLTGLVLDQLDNWAGGHSPFFLGCHYWEPHAPYLPTEDFKDLHDPGDFRPWPSFQDDLGGKPLLHRKLRESIFPGAAQAGWETWARVLSRYYAQCAMVDHEVGRLLDGLRERGLYETTTIIFASDHGESVGIHGGAFDKGGMAYEELYRIPLIIKPAGPSQPGRVCREWVSLIDLAPTFCRIAGTDLPGAHGRDLSPLLQDPDLPWREDLMAEDHGHRVPFAQRILWWRNWKYVFNLSDRDELYDLDRDPAEMTNRIGDPSVHDVSREMRRRLLTQLQATGDPLGPQTGRMLTHPPGIHA